MTDAVFKSIKIYTTTTKSKKSEILVILYFTLMGKTYAYEYRIFICDIYLKKIFIYTGLFS